MQELLQYLLLNDSEKLRQTNSHQLGQLLLSLSRMVQPSGSWPLMRAVLEHATSLLKQQLEPQQPQQLQQAPQQQQLETSAVEASPSADTSSSNPRQLYRAGVGKEWDRWVGDRRERWSGEAARRPRQQRERSPEEQKTWEQRQQGIAVATVNSTALIALLLDRCNTFSPEYFRLQYQWIEDGEKLPLLYPNAACQLWAALKGHWAKFEARTAANAASGAAAGKDGAAGAAGVEGVSAEGAADPAGECCCLGFARGLSGSCQGFSRFLPGHCQD